MSKYKLNSAADQILSQSMEPAENQTVNGSEAAVPAETMEPEKKKKIFPKREKKERKINFLLEESLYEKMYEKAYTQELTVSQYLRKLIKDDLSDLK